jgi:hypothetical protein
MAVIGQAIIVERILRHLGLPTDRPEPQPGRAPPRSAFVPELSAEDDATF